MSPPVDELPADHPFRPSGPSKLQAAFEARAGSPSEDTRPVAALADLTRRLIDELVSTTAPTSAVIEAGELVARATALLAGQPHGRPYEGFAESSMAGDARSFLDHSPMAGPLNPLAPPLLVEVQGDHVQARATFAAAYEGPPGCVHGGFIAASFDEVLGFVQSLTGRPGMTGRLVVQYRSPTPLFVPVHFDGWVESVVGRKILTRATLHHGDVLTAEAEGLFISIDPSVFVRLMEERRRP